MSRMSEVFELPVKVGEGYGCCLLYSEDAPIASFNYEDYSSYAAHAINHVDALADALSALLKELDLTYVHCSNLSDAIESADMALVAYRGDK